MFTWNTIINQKGVFRYVTSDARLKLFINFASSPEHATRENIFNNQRVPERKQQVDQAQSKKIQSITIWHPVDRPFVNQPERVLSTLHPAFEHIELPAKLLDYFLRSNKSNINQSGREICSCRALLCFFTVTDREGCPQNPLLLDCNQAAARRMWTMMISQTLFSELKEFHRRLANLNA